MTNGDPRNVNFMIRLFRFGAQSEATSLRRRVVLFGCAALAAAAAVSPAAAGDWPERPIRVIVPYGAGGTSDTLARLTADRLSKMLKQPMVIENRAGAGGAIGTEVAARADADGYTLFFASVSQITVSPLTHKLKFDPMKDLTPISLVGENPMGIAVHPSFPAKTLKEMIDYVRANPGKVNYANAGIGTNSHLVGAAFTKKLGLKMVAVPYKSANPATTAVIAGEVPVYFGNTTDTIKHAKNGTLRQLAVTTEKRLPQYPDIPTVAETVPGFSWVSFNAVFAPTGTPQPIIDRVAKDIAAICKDPDFVKRLEPLGVVAHSTTPAESIALVKEDAVRSAEAVDAAGVRVK
jgi:tripartite-type tricarboxylate transporter receptor subunit TctC